MLDYRPDLDPRTPGLLTYVRDMVPTAKGYRCAYRPSAHTAHTYAPVGNETYPTSLFASRWLSTPGGIVIVGTNKRLNVYDYTNGFINVSHAAGDYALGGGVYQNGEDAVSAFDLCAYGDVIIAANKTVTAQKRSALDLTVATLFTDLGNGAYTPAPAANTCCVAANFVFLGDCGNWSTVTGSPDILAWSALGDHTDWRVNPQVTQCSYAQFNDTPGPITCVRPFRDGVVVFKAESMYLGRYVGAATPNSPIWDFQRVSNKIGCAGHRSIADIDAALVFVGRDDIYYYDGTRPVSITQGIYETLRPAITGAYGVAVLVGHDKPNASCWFQTDNANIYVWNYKLNRWGLLYSNSLGTMVAMCQTNCDDFRKKTLSAVTIGVQSYTTSTNHFNVYTLQLVNGSPLNRNSTRVGSNGSYLVTGAIGKPGVLSVLSRVTPVFSIAPVTVGNLFCGYNASVEPAAPTAGASMPMNAKYRFDLLATGISKPFVFISIFAFEDCEIIDVIPALSPNGEL